MAQTSTVTPSAAATRTIKAISKAFFSASKSVPEGERAAIEKEALASIQASMKEAREKQAAAKLKAKAKADAAAAKLKAKATVKAKAPAKRKGKSARKASAKAVMPPAPLVPANGSYTGDSM